MVDALGQTIVLPSANQVPGAGFGYQMFMAGAAPGVA
jgi:hypothetical protein